LLSSDNATEPPITFLGRRVPAWVELRVVVVRPGESRPYDESEWSDAIVVVERGAIVLETHSGVCRRFVSGDILWLAAVPLRALHNREPEQAVLAALARRLRTHERS
jgi:hypothetical protein